MGNCLLALGKVIVKLHLLIFQTVFIKPFLSGDDFMQQYQDTLFQHQLLSYVTLTQIGFGNSFGNNCVITLLFMEM